MKSKYKLGQEVTVLHRLVRKSHGVKISWKVSMYPKPLKGILVGVRILNDGYMEGNYGEQYYVPAKPKKALLVAINLKQTILMFA